MRAASAPASPMAAAAADSAEGCAAAAVAAATPSATSPDSSSRRYIYAAPGGTRRSMLARARASYNRAGFTSSFLRGALGICLEAREVGADRNLLGVGRADDQ